LHDSTPRPTQGIALALLAVACFSALDTTTQWVAGAAPMMLALFIRYLVQACVASVPVLRPGGRALLRSAHPRFHLARTVLLLLVSILAFLSLRLMPVGEFTAIVMVTPLLVTLFAARLFAEQVNARQWLFVAGGFIGTLLIVRPGGSAFSWLLALPLVLVVLNAGFQLLTSRMTRTEDPRTLQFYAGWIGSVCAGVPLIWLWSPVTDARVWLGMAFMGLASTQGHLFLIRAFQSAPASALMPYMYMQIPFSMLGGWLVTRHAPDGWGLAGIALIGACGVGGALARQRTPIAAQEAISVLEASEH